MQKRNTFNTGGFICLIILLYLMYGVLLESEMLPFSIGAVYTKLNHWVKHWHVVVVGLLPVYVSLTFFGAVVFGIFFGTRLQGWIARFFSDKHVSN